MKEPLAKKEAPIQKEDLQGVLNEIRRCTPRGWILMSPNSIGEALMTAAFARALEERTGYPVTICVRDPHVDFIEKLYPGRFSAVVRMNSGLMTSFLAKGLAVSGLIDIDLPIVLHPHYYGSGRLRDIQTLIYRREGTSGLTAPDEWRYMLNLDWDAPMERPCTAFFENEHPLFTDLDPARGDYVVFQPGNNSNRPPPACFWQNLEALYLEEGKQVFANARGARLLDESLIFQRTRWLELDIMDAAYLSYHAGALLCGGNGFVQLMSFLDYRHKDCSPLIHTLATDKYNVDPSRVESYSEAWYESHRGVNSTATGYPEMLSPTCRFSEWLIPTDLDNHDYGHLARAVFENDESSPHYCSPGKAFRQKLFPSSIPFGHSIEPLSVAVP